MMNRILGLLVGFALAGPLGGLVGFLLGLYVDKNMDFAFKRNFGFGHVFKQQFLETMFILMGHVAKADGRISEIEISHARQFMQQLGLKEAQKEQAIRWFYQGKNQQFNLDELLFRLKPFAGMPHMRLLIQALADIIHVNKNPHPEQERILRYICDYFGLPFPQYRQYQQYQQSYQRTTPPKQQHSLSQAYQLLGLKMDSKEAEIRTAYRRLVSKYHPDKVSARGGSEKEMKTATDKTHHIRMAYEQIMRSKGISV